MCALKVEGLHEAYALACLSASFSRVTTFETLLDVVFEEMVENGASSSYSAETECSYTEPPDRRRFQEQISFFNARLDDLSDRLRQLIGRPGESTPIRTLRERREALRAERTRLAKEDQAALKEMKEYKTTIDAKAGQISELQGTMVSTRQGYVESQLKHWEDRYNRGQFKDNREEQLVVREIDKFKRNLKAIEKYNSLTEEKRMMERKLSDMKSASSNRLTEIKKLSRQERDVHNRLKGNAREALDVKKQLFECRQERRELIDEYESHRKGYANHLRAQKKRKEHVNSLPATFPNAHPNGAMYEENELEPFYEQKRDCERLIRYLERLETQMDKSNETDTSVSSQNPDSDDSAEDFPAAFSKFSIYAASSQVQAAQRRKKAKKMIKKSTQPISHSIDIYQLFVTLELKPPKTYEDVCKSLQEVRERLEFFRQQTGDIEWNLEDYMGDSALFRPPSDLTVDSGACASETSSVNSYSLASGSHSPLVQPPKIYDEGINSTNSSL